MDMIDLRYLLAAVEAGNFAKAANALGRDESSISRRIAHFEEELGLTLFERGHFAIRLTKGGKGVMIYARRVLAGFDAVMTAGRCYGEGEAGEIRLGVRMPPVGESLRSILGIWRKKNPGVVLPGTRRARKQPWAASSLSCAMQRDHGVCSSAPDALSFPKARSVAIKRASIGPMSFVGSSGPPPISRPSAWA
jgi:DNA-binding transcriptional LysR family regulator